MAQPRDYTRQYNFNDFATTDPSSPLPGQQVDNELNAVKLTLDDLNANIELIQRDDGKIRNQTIHKDALDVDALALVTSGAMNPRGSWSSSNTYAIADIVDFNDATYFATIAHSASNAFQTDLAASKWILIANAAIANTASVVDKFEGDGNTTAFTLSFTYTGDTDALVFVNGSLRNPGDDYTLSGTTVTFVTAPSSPSVAGNENVIIWGTSVVVAAAKQAAESAASNAQGHRDTAQEWASKVNGDVDSSGEYSSKDHAIGGTGVDTGTGSAKDWATKISGTVGNSTEYSAKYWATTGDVNTIATNIGDINDVAGQISPTNNINTIANRDTDIGTVALRDTDIGIVADRDTDIGTVANRDADIGTVANRDTDIGTVALRDTDIGTVAARDTDIGTVASVSGDISSLASVLGASTTYAVTVAQSGGINVFYLDGAANPTLTFDRGNTYIFDLSDSSNSGHPLAFKDGSGNSYTTGVTTTGTPGTAGAQVQIDVESNAPASLRYYCTVHGNGMGNTISVVNSNLAVVASNITNVNNVGGSIADVNALAATDVLADMAAINNTDVLADMAALNNTDVLADMAALGEAAVITDMAALSTTDVLADMAALNDTTVLGNMALLGTSDAVADMALLGTADAVADMNTLGTADAVADMNTLADVAADITTLAHIEDGTVATNAIQTVAAMDGQVESFAQKYRIGASDPTLDNDEGDLFYNTTSNELKIFSNTAWVKVGNDVNVMDRYEFVASSGQTIFTGADMNGNALAINTTSYFVTINGGMIESDDINSVTATALTLTSDAAAELGDYVTVTSFNKFAPTNAMTTDGTAQSKSGNLTISGGALFNVDGAQGVAPAVDGHATVINRGLAITKRGSDGNPDISTAYGTYAQDPSEYNLYIESTDSFAGGIAMRGKHAQLALSSEDSLWGFHFGGNTTKNVTVSRHGISFNNSLNYATTPTAANSMNHYEQGTWTPILADAATSGNEITPSVDSATFTRIGNVVHLAFSDQNVGISPISGTYSNLDAGNDVFIKGLPYSLNHRFVGAVTGEFSYTTGESPVVFGETGNSYLKIALTQNNNTALDFAVFGGMSAYSGFHFQITYFTDDA